MRLFKKIIYLLTALIAFLFISLSVITYFYGSEVKQYIIGELNKSIRIKVKVKDVDFTVFRYFPNVSITFNEVYARNILDDDTLCNARRISLLFNLKDVFEKNYLIRRIYIYDASAKLAIDEAGNDNFTFWDTNNAANKKFAIKLSLLKGEKLRIVYTNNNLHRCFESRIDAITLSGNFSEKNYFVNTAIEGFLNNYNVSKNTILKNKPFKIKLRLAVAGNKYTISSGNISLAHVSLTAAGDFYNEQDHTKLNLAVSSRNLDLKEVPILIPKKYLSKADGLIYAGIANIDIKIKGILNSTRIPNIDASFNISKGKIEFNNSGKTALEEVTFTGTYINHADGKDLLVLRNVSAKNRNNPIKGNISISNLLDPYIKLDVNSNMSISSVLTMAGETNMKQASGDVDINLILEGKLEYLKTPADYIGTTVKIKSLLKLNNVSFHYDKSNLDLNHLNGSFQNEGNDVLFSELSGTANGSDFLLNGKIDNAVSWIFGKNIPLSMNASLYAHTLDFNKILAIKTDNKDSGNYRKAKFENIQLKVNIANVYYKAISLQAFSANIIVTPTEYSFNNLFFNTLAGTIRLDAKLIMMHDDSSMLRGNAHIKRVNIKELFKRLDNFGQNTLTDANINGSLTADVGFSGILNNKLKLNLNSLEMISDIAIDNGQLLNFKPVMALAKYTKLNELQDVKFSTLKNQISIKNSVITMPEMEISSNVLNLKASGTHTFTNQMDYKLQLRLSELLGRKARQLNTAFGEIEDDGTGKTLIPLRMYGDISNPKFSIDKVSVKKGIVKDLKKEWKSLKEVFKKEFNNGPQTTVPIESGVSEKEIDLENASKNNMPIKKEAPKQKTRLQKLKEKLKGDQEDQL